MKHKMIITMLAVALMALHATAQTYRIQGTAYRAQTAVPSMAFQSTGSMVGSGSVYTSNPSLNEDGTAAYSPAQAPGRPRKATMDEDPFGGETIGGTGNPNEPGTPIGDGLWAMMLLAGAYLIWRATRRRALKG